MTWHLKDRELEKKLIEIAPNFVESLNESLKLVEHEENFCTYKIGFGPYKDCYKFEMHVYDDELEEVPEYNPKAWNDFPKVKPPYDVMMRIEFENGEGTKGFYKHCLDGSDYWFGNSRMAFSKNMLINNPIKRFRPWED